MPPSTISLRCSPRNSPSPSTPNALKILISSHAFAPSIGGIETVSRLLAAEFVRLGHAVTVVTQTPENLPAETAYRIMRRPSLPQLFHAVQWCDIFWQNNLSLRTVWPALILRKPLVITQQGSYCRRPSGIDLGQRLKHALVRRAPSVAISRAVTACFETDSVIIPNPYDAMIFRRPPCEQERPADLIFIGRLVTEKGIDLLLEALARLRARNLFPRLTIVGPGPDRSAMEQVSKRLGLGEEVTFL